MNRKWASKQMQPKSKSTKPCMHSTGLPGYRCSKTNSGRGRRRQGRLAAQVHGARLTARWKSPRTNLIQCNTWLTYDILSKRLASTSWLKQDPQLSQRQKTGARWECGSQLCWWPLRQSFVWWVKHVRPTTKYSQIKQKKTICVSLVISMLISQ